MQYEHISVQERAGILIVTMNRPKALNAINRRTMQELHHLFGEDAPQRKHLHGVIITGAGDRAFVAGADIKEFLQLENDEAETMARFGHDTYFLIERFAKPVVAAVNGFALGAGCELAMACHLRVAGEHARFGQPEVNLGIIPGYAGTQRLPQLVGKGRALHLLLTADMIDAQTAEAIGLVNQVVAPGEEVEAAQKLLEKIATKGPVAVQKIIECVNAHYQHDADGFDREVREFGATARTNDFQEGAAAFVEKRPANFAGA